jgi:hypothetical protein
MALPENQLSAATNRIPTTWATVGFNNHSSIRSSLHWSSQISN